MQLRQRGEQPLVPPHFPCAAPQVAGQAVEHLHHVLLIHLSRLKRLFIFLPEIDQDILRHVQPSLAQRLEQLAFPVEREIIARHAMMQIKLLAPRLLIGHADADQAVQNLSEKQGYRPVFALQQPLHAL